MSEKKLARLAGAFYLIIIVCGLFSEGFVRMNLVDFNSAEQTANNIMASQTLFRVGMIGDLMMVMADIVVAGIFYQLLKSVDQTLALLAMLFRLVQASIIGLNLINYFSPLLALAEINSGGAFSAAQLEQIILFSLESHKYGYLISQFFFSFNCLIMGYLLYISTHFPKLLGIGIGLAGVSYLIDAIANFSLPAVASTVSAILVIPVLTEISLCYWLLAKGTKV